MDINKLLNGSRRKDKAKIITSESVRVEARTEIERDYDRILFSTPVRRMADKTQVFPLEKNDSVRTRLTHSHEVSNLARSVGNTLVFEENSIFPNDNSIKRNVPSLLAAIGLAHDLGNPPFGHKGEVAISSWFEENKKIALKGLNEQERQDFLSFEGNAQTLRLLTRLQIISDDFGLNLSYATLSALMKYPVPSNRRGSTAASKKFGFFKSEQHIVDDIWRETGLSQGVRHPLTYIMEACDDIAYSILDAEDAIKKNVASFHDLIEWLNFYKDGCPLVERVVKQAEGKHSEHRKQQGLSPAELNDISTQMLRVFAIGEMISAVTTAFKNNYKFMLAGEFEKDLIAVSDAKTLCKILKSFDLHHAYKNKSVLELELHGYNTIQNLMDMLWVAVTDNGALKELNHRHKDPFAQYAYTKISESYRRVFSSISSSELSLRYKQCQLMTDMVSGMTDSFAISLEEHLSKYFKQ